MNAQHAYPFDEIVVMSLERTPERYRRWEGASAIMKIDPAIVSIAFGKDNRDFDDDMKAIAEAAAADGFGFVEEYAQGIRRNGTQQTGATTCQIWNYCRILRELANHKKTALILFDDKMLTIDFQEFCQLASEVQSVAGEEFYALQLSLRGHPSELEFSEIDLDTRIKTSLQIFQGAFGGNIESLKDLFFRPGISGYDENILWSPSGAEWMLKCLEMAPDTNYQYLDHFICKALPSFAEAALKRKKGVYCPAELGYKFVDTFMSMGTTTDYATPGSRLYEASRRRVEFNRFWEQEQVEGAASETLEAELDAVLKRGKS